MNGSAFARFARSRVISEGSYHLIGRPIPRGFVNGANAYPNRVRPDRSKDRAFTVLRADNGKYFGYNASNIFQASRGTWRFSHYYYLRNGTGTSWQTGPQLAVTVAEMDLIKAEALIRLNRAAEAVPLINKTRIANGQLPPVTIDGPADEPGCVPRKLNGQCGSLWDALRYEKGVEMIGTDGVVRSSITRMALFGEHVRHMTVPREPNAEDGAQTFGVWCQHGDGPDGALPGALPR